jgi:hypothetical protein
MPDAAGEQINAYQRCVHEPNGLGARMDNGQMKCRKCGHGYDPKERE